MQWGSALAAAQTPNWKSCGVGWKPRAWSGLKPSCPVRTTVKPHPGPGVPSDAFGYRIAYAGDTVTTDDPGMPDELRELAAHLGQLVERYEK